MEKLLQTIRELKTKAKNRRDLKRYDNALSILHRATALIENELSLTTSPDGKEQLASELSDCFGLLGGIYRRWGLESENEEDRSRYLNLSVDAYQKGYTLEKVEEYHIANSYNMLNRLVSYILLKPDSLSNTAPIAISENAEALPIPQELQAAKATIQDQLREKRRGDIWALADLALLKLLLDEENPDQAYADFIAQSPPDYAYESTLSVLRPMAELDIKTASKFKQAAHLMDAKLNELRPQAAPAEPLR